MTATTRTSHSVEGVSLEVVTHLPAVTSSAAPILVLHGFTGDSESMAGVAEAFADTHTTHRVELLGHGGSEAPPALEAYAMEACVRQLAALQDALDARPAHWIGYSMGGRAALSIAARHPERVRSLVLVGASPGLADAAARSERVATDAALAQRILDEGVEAFVDHWMALPLFASQARLGPAALAAARAQRLRNRPQGLARSLAGLGTGAMPPLHAALREIDVPVCLVAGAEDAKFEAIADAMAAALPRAERVSVPSAGHAAHVENPGAFARAARRFVARVDAGFAAGATPAEAAR